MRGLDLSRVTSRPRWLLAGFILLASVPLLLWAGDRVPGREAVFFFAAILALILGQLLVTIGIKWENDSVTRPSPRNFALAATIYLSIGVLWAIMFTLLNLLPAA